ncbi:MAG: hypothetical protein NWF13_07310 [Candidatus Bathyarchaeota archaeon]|nr:hypothetical protein [Candidatus Bathyarchaeota archaeon]
MLSNFFHFLYMRIFKGHCPTVKDRESEKVKQLATRLKGNSDAETLTNILEWQNRNIEFWTERHPMWIILLLICLVFIIIRFFNLGWVFPESAYDMLLGGIATLVITIAVILHLNRKIPVIDGFVKIITPSISIDFLLKNRLGVCRDYAKLTACLLSNIYPNEKIYFASAHQHVATGIKIKNELYMLDQRLPILTINKWDDHRKLTKIERFNIVNQVLIKRNKNCFLKLKNKSVPDIKTLTLKMARLLNVKGKQTDDRTLEICWKNGFMLYEDDEIVNYSLARAIRMKATDKVVNTNTINEIQIEHKDNDLIFLLNYNV